MKRLFLLGLLGLTGLVIAWGTPQTSDADLKSAQNPTPALTSDDGTTVNGHGLKLTLPGVIDNLQVTNFLIDASGVSSISPGTMVLSGCTLTAGNSALLAAIEAWVGGTPSGSAYLLMDGIGLSGAVVLEQDASAKSHFGFANNAITSVDISFAHLDLENDGLGSPDLDFSNNPDLTSLNTAGGTEGIGGYNAPTVTFNGCALDIYSEDGLLTLFQTLFGSTSGSIDISGGSNAGLDDTGRVLVSELVANSWIVTTN